MTQKYSPVITVIGKLKDTAPYRGLPGYNVFPECEGWTPERNRIWIDRAIERGDSFLIVSNDYRGEFLNELVYLLQQLIEKGAAQNIEKRLRHGS